MSDRLIGVLAKIERANKHIEDLEREVQAFVNDNGNGNPQVIDFDSETGQVIHRIELNRPIPVAISLIAGDVTHNLRSALDHLAWQLVLAGGGNPDKSTAFPICATAEAFKEKPAVKKIQGVTTEAKRVIEAIQPYNTGDKLLSILSKINNFDKHEILMVFAMKIAGTLIRFDIPVGTELSVGQEYISNVIDFGDPSIGPKCLENHDELARVVTGGRQLDCDVEFAFDIAFSEPRIAYAMPVYKVLANISDRVSWVVDQFRPTSISPGGRFSISSISSTKLPLSHWYPLIPVSNKSFRKSIKPDNILRLVGVVA